VQDFYIPLGSDADDILAYCAAAYRDRPLAGQRLRMEKSFIPGPLDQESDPDEQAVVAQAFADMGETSDVALDPDQDAVEMSLASAQGVVNLRVLLRDGLYYQRTNRLEEPGGGSAPARWDQLIDLHGSIMIVDNAREMNRPERYLERLDLVLAGSGVELEVGPDEALPRGETGCLVTVTIHDSPSLSGIAFKSMREQLDAALEFLRFPIVMTMLISRDTGYLHRQEMEVDIDNGDKMKLRLAYYNLGQPVHISAPPANEVNPLLVPETITVVEAQGRPVNVTFVGQDGDLDEDTYALVNATGKNPFPDLVVGDRVSVRVMAYDSEKERNLVGVCSVAGANAHIWRFELSDREVDEQALPEAIDLTVVEVEELHGAAIIAKFPDDRQETALMYGPQPFELPAIGERLTAYRRQMPEGPVVIGLRRGGEVVWSRD
jgi:hypothetical protein